VVGTQIARPTDLDWARELRDRCVENDVVFFIKQLGAEHKKRGKEEPVLDARRWMEYPT